MKPLVFWPGASFFYGFAKRLKDFSDNSQVYSPYPYLAVLMISLFKRATIVFLIVFTCNCGLSTSFAQIPKLGAPYLNGDARIKLGIEKHDKELYEEAIDQYKKVHSGDSAYVLSQHELGLSLFAAKRNRESLEVLLAIKDRKSISRDIQLLIANNYDDLAMPDSADWWYNQVRTQFPLHHMADYEAAISRIRTKKYKDALNCLYEALIRKPLYHKVHLRIGYLAAEAGQPVLAMLAYHFATILVSDAESKIEIITVNESVASDEYQKNLQSVPNDIFGNSDALAELNQIVLSKLALNKNYKPGLKIDFKLTRQLQFILEKLPKSSEDLPLITKFYLDFYRKALEVSSYQAIILSGLQGVNNEDISKAVKKENSVINKFANWAGGYLLDMRTNFMLPLSDGTKKNVRVIFSNGEVSGFGEAIVNDKLNGDWSFVSQTGEINAKGKYVLGKREGLWNYFSNGKVIMTEEFKNGKEEGAYKRYFETGVISEEGFQKNGLFEGLILLYHPSGKLSAKINAVAGKRSGLYRGYDEFGLLSSEYEEIDNKKQGKATFYHSNGNRKTQGQYVDDLRDGKWTFWFKNGSIEAEGNYENGNLVGEWSYWHPNGAKERKLIYVKGNLEGVSKKWYTNGNLKSEENYKAGELNGVSTYYAKGGWKYAVLNVNKGILRKAQYWNSKGELIQDKSYSADSFSMVDYDEYGQIVSEGSYQNGFKEGSWNYYSGGVRTQTSNYSKGVKEGIETEFFSNGKTKSEFFYRNGELNGFFRTYHISGTPRAEGYFNQGTRVGAWDFFYSNGEPDSREFYVDGELNGSDREYEVNGQLLFENWFDYGVFRGASQYDSSGKLYNQSLLKEYSGMYKQIHSNKKILFEVEYKNGKKVDGIQTTYNALGEVRKTERYKNGVRDGVYEEFFPGGKLFIRSWYKNGDKDSIENEFSDFGRSYRTTRYVEGKKEGLETLYHISGIKVVEANFENNNLNGLKRYYNEQGVVVAVLEYDEGSLVGSAQMGADGKLPAITPVLAQTVNIKALHPNGKLAFDFKIVNGEYEGNYLVYQSNGMKLSSRKYVSGQLQGVLQDYGKNGKLLKQAEYLNDDEHGAYKFFYEDGLLKEEGQFKFGNLHGWIQYYTAIGKPDKKVYFYYGSRY